MKFLKGIKLLAFIPILLVASCSKDKDPSPLSPEVLSSTPVADAIDVPTNSVIKIVFNTEMDPTTLNATTFTLVEGSNSTTGTFSYADSTAVFTPSGNLKEQTTFTGRLTVGAKDMNGLALKKDFTFSFKTSLALDLVLPTVTSIDPLNNATNVPLNKVISITFNEPMNASSIDASSFLLKKGTIAVTGSVAYTGSTATFTPSVVLEAGTVYNATVTTNVKDLAGNAIATAKIWSFTIDAIPTVTSTNPLDNATNVVRNKVISINFNEPMNASTINATSFLVKQGVTVVNGAVNYSGNTATFISNTILESGLIYTVTVTTSVKDLGGNAIATAKEWSFTTGTVSGLAVVNLGASGNYVILAKTAINVAPTSAITGDLGLSPAATSYITGLSLTDATGYATSAQVTGKVYAADMAPPTNTNLTTAVENMLTAYTDAAGRPTPDYLNLGTGDIGGQTLVAGLYNWNTTVTIPADVVISGSADDVWIFQISNDLTMSAEKNIILQGGAQAKNIFWQVAGEVVIGADSHFEGVILCQTGITLQTRASFKGRALAQSAVILDSNAVTKP